MKNIMNYNSKIGTARLYSLVTRYSTLDAAESNELANYAYSLANKVRVKYYPFTIYAHDMIQHGVMNLMYDLYRGAYKPQFKNATAFAWQSIRNGMLVYYRKEHPKLADDLEFIPILIDEDGNYNVDIVDVEPEEADDNVIYTIDDYCDFLFDKKK